MKEEDALADAPQGSGAELVWPGGALGGAVGEAFAHVMDEEVGVKIGGLIGKGGAGVGGGTAGNLYACFKRRRVIVDAANRCKCGAYLNAPAPRGFAVIKSCGADGKPTSTI
jgi:hypothetical protein